MKSNHIRQMDPQGLRRARHYLEQENRKHPAALAEVPRAKWPSGNPTSLVRVLRSRGFAVQVYAVAPGVNRMSVNRAAIQKDGAWQCDISWEELQELKRQAGYGDKDAVEVYPAEKDIVNVANMRYLWILDQAVPFAWRSK